MFFAEPPPTRYDLHFRLAGVPVRVHPLFWLVGTLLGAGADAPPVQVLIWLVAVFFSILVHEFGHALAFGRYGVRSHIVLYSFGGLAVPDSAYAGLPSRRARYGSPQSQVLVAFAGPAAGFALAAAVVAALYFAGYHVSFSTGLASFLDFEFGPPDNPIPYFKVSLLVHFLLYINIFWGLVNLLPIYPLDGGQIFRAILVRFNPADGVRQSLMLSVFTAAGLAVVVWVKLQSVFMGLLFGYLAYLSFATLQSYGGGGYGGGRGW